MQNGTLMKSVEDLVALYVARADFHRRRWEEIVAGLTEGDSETFKDAAAILREGIEAVFKGAIPLASS